MNPEVDTYFIEGCGRCPLGGTPRCKVNNWREEMKQLRQIILDCGLTEELKWRVPCYTFQNSNIVLLSAFNDYSAVSFFKGALLNDTEGILEKPGENTQAARLIRFTNVKQVARMKPILKDYLYKAIEVEKAGLKVDFKEKNQLLFPKEFQQKLDEMPALKTAFEALTPGRQRGYILFFSQPKQSQTRASRIEKCIPQILRGKGFYDK